MASVTGSLLVDVRDGAAEWLNQRSRRHGGLDKRNAGGLRCDAVGHKESGKSLAVGGKLRHIFDDADDGEGVVGQADADHRAELRQVHDAAEVVSAEVAAREALGDDHVLARAVDLALVDEVSGSMRAAGYEQG